MPRITLALVAVLSFMAFTPVSAQDFFKGNTAYDAGDYAKAFAEWKPLAERGNPWAQYSLGMLYGEGQGVVQDYAEAVRWFKLANVHGVADAQTALGTMFSRGDGVPQNDFEAINLFRLAAKQGHSLAHWQLGGAYQLGKGVEEDPFKAHMWYNIASANGDEMAADNRDQIAKIYLWRPADISKAQAMARECMSSGYEKCGY